MDHRAPLWTFVGVFVLFKILTTAIIIYADPNGVGTALGVFVAFHWPMMLAGLAVAVSFAVLAIKFRVRLFRVRSRRQALLESEWRVEARP